MDFRTVNLVDLASEVRSRKRRATELAESALARIDELDSKLNAFVVVDHEGALRQAAEVDRRLDAGEGVGPLAGIPLAVKDLEDAAGLPTRYGSVLSDDSPAEGDSVLVARLRAAGCVIVGKTTTPEYGHKGTTESPLSGETRNPWSLDRSPGGSSGGSAAALASGMVPLATGSDGGGSIRIPAAVCGLTGMKVTQGRIPNGGPNPPGSGLFAVKGPMARRAADTSFALNVCLGPHPTDPFSLPRSGAPWYEAVSTTSRLPDRVVYSPTLGFANVDSEIAGISQRAVQDMESAGVEVVMIDDIWPLDPVAAWYPFWAAHRAAKQGHLVDGEDWERIDASLRLQIKDGLKVSGTELIRAHDELYNYNLALDAVFEQAPILITPMCAGQAPQVGHNGTVNGAEVLAWVSFSYGFNMTRNPAGTVSCGRTADGMPVGLQVVGRQLDDVSVLQTMAGLEALYDLSDDAPID